MPKRHKTKTRRAGIKKCNPHNLVFTDADLAKTTYMCSDCGHVEFVYEDSGTGA